MAARTGRPYKLQVLSTNGERKLQGSANKPTLSSGQLKVILPFLAQPHEDTVIRPI